jgi:hypothetical protein
VVSQMCYSGEIVVPRPKIVKKLSKKMVKKLSKSCQKAVKKLQKVVKKLSKNSSSKAFGISFADRPKAKNTKMDGLQSLQSGLIVVCSTLATAQVD